MDTTPQIIGVWLEVAQDSPPRLTVEYDREGPVAGEVVAAVAVDPEVIGAMIRSVDVDAIKTEVLASPSLSQDVVASAIGIVADRVEAELRGDE